MPQPSAATGATGSAMALDPVGSNVMRRGFRGTGAYAIALFLQRGITFVLLPLYTRVLTPAEYGQLAIVLTISTGAATLLTFGLEASVFRSFILLRSDPTEQRRFVNSVGLLGLFGPFVVTLVVLLFANDELASFFGVPARALALGILTAATQVALAVVPLALLRAQERLRSYLRLTAIQVGLTTALTVILVVVMDMGVTGWLVATLVGVAIALITGLAMLDHRWTFAIDRRHVVAALAFGLPLVPHAAANWGLALSDRLILSAYVAPAAIGLYQLAFNMALPVSTLAAAMTRGTAPMYAHAVHSEPDRRGLAGLITQHVILTALAGMAIAVCGPAIVTVLLPGEYAGAAAYIPLLALGAVFYGWYFVPMNVVALLAGQTRWVWIATVAAAGVNIGLNLVTVPAFGAPAAAANSAIGYGVLLLGVLVFMRGVNQPLGLEWARIGIGCGLVALAGVCGILLTRDMEPLPSLVTAIFVALAAPLVLVLTGIWQMPHTRSDPPRSAS